MTKMFKPKIENKAPAAAPVPVQAETPDRKLGDETEATEIMRKKRGRGSLRIDPQTGGVGASRTGINVPMK